MSIKEKPRLAIWKFTGCDGCQLSVLNVEKKLSQIINTLEISYFYSKKEKKVNQPYDISLIEGSINNEDDIDLLQDIRKSSRFLVAMGSCANAGGVQALRNAEQNRNEFNFFEDSFGYNDYREKIKNSLPIQEYVKVDYELRGCPIDEEQLLELTSAIFNEREPTFSTATVCSKCKKSGIECLVVSKQINCMGPVTQSGCGAICPSFDRGCYGCFGPIEEPNVKSFTNMLRQIGKNDDEIMRTYKNLNSYAEEFREEYKRLKND